MIARYYAALLYSGHLHMTMLGAMQVSLLVVKRLSVCKAVGLVPRCHEMEI